MKKTVLITFVVLLTLSPLLAYAATLRVTGNAVLTVTPDRATLEIGVSKDDADAGVALRMVAESIQSIQSAVLAVGIADENIKTSYLSTYPMQNWDHTPPSAYYRVEHMLQIRIDDITQTGGVLDAAFAAGANQGGHIRYDASNGDEVYEEALALAVENASGKANALAIASGVWLGQLEQVNEYSSFIPYTGRSDDVNLTAMSEEFDTALSMGDVLATGDIEISASVELVYAIR
ncbi:MAG: SIMPL domain-containing protein [Clostridia bacterium]|nr:SIMPL domain-containing protein [Clostridia bacterium]